MSFGDPMPWADEALCAQTDPAIFFPPASASPKQAKAICAKCPVINECLQYALSTLSVRAANNHDVSARTLVGVWGGTTYGERVCIRRGYCTSREHTHHKQYTGKRAI